MADGPINSLTYNGITAIVTNGYLDRGVLVSDDITPYPATRDGVEFMITKRTENSSAGNTLVTLTFPQPVTRFGITVEMTTYDGSAVTIYDQNGTILKSYPIKGSQSVIYDPAPASIEYIAVEGALIGRVDLKPSTRPDYIRYTGWLWGDPPPTPTPAPPSDPIGPIRTPTPRRSPTVTPTPGTTGTPGSVGPITNQPIAPVPAFGSPEAPLPSSFDSPILASYIEQEIRAEIDAEFGPGTIVDSKLIRISVALARAIRKYLLKDVRTYQRAVDVIPIGLTGAGTGGPVTILPNPHDHGTVPHAHKINAP